MVLSGVFSVMPTSTNYSLKGYDVGTGGGSGSSSSYKLNGVSGTQTSVPNSSATYNAQSGLAPEVNSNVPPAPSFSNPSSYYDRLKLVVNTGNNPSDARFAIAISTDNFATTQYVKADQSIGATLTQADMQTYATWGGPSGFLILGLQQSTTYSVKIRATQGDFTETSYGPTVSAATVSPYITFAVATTASSVPPFSLGFSSLSPGTTYDGDADASLTLATNALFGGSVYLSSSNAGLSSAQKGYTLTSSTADLASVGKGYGVTVTSTSQSAGGPLVASAPYNGSGNNVGGLSTVLQELVSTGAAVTGGSISVRFKAKTDIGVPPATDYADLLTFIAATAF